MHTLVVGCGVSPQQYDQMASELGKQQEQNVALQGGIDQLKAQNQALEGQVTEAQSQVEKLEGQISDLKEQYELVGETPAETAAKIVRYYHETHVYSTYDLFVCSDMAAEVWNMLKAQGINAVVVVGDIDTPTSDIVLSDHAWVLAEVAPGERLALETTDGYAVPQSQNALYYRGWFFNTPGELKNHNALIREYNVRVEIRRITEKPIRIPAMHEKNERSRASRRNVR